jgi:pimeloyl-ACP methyl ester carboxylesterase
MIQHFVCNGARLRFFDTGSGLPVLFLHPTPLSHAYWLPVITRLKNRRAIALDLRGHGGSELEGSLPEQALPVGGFVPGVAELTLERLAEDVLAMLDYLKIEKADFVGCSIGGYLLLELWRRAPERMSRLAFVCSKAQGDTPEGREKRKLTIEKIQSDGVEATLDGLVKSLTGATSQRENPTLTGELRAMATLNLKSAQAVQAGLGLRPDSLATVETIQRPVLAIAGEEDAVCTAQEMEAFKKAPGGCEFHLLAKTGHFSACEQPDAVAAIIQSWLER